MGLFNKLKEILFDEETVEIPVITKEDKPPKEMPKEKRVIEEESKRRTTSVDDEVIIHKIETPKRDVKVEEADTFDMPKLKEEAKEEIKKSTFTFPIFEDDDDKPVTSKRERRETVRREKEEQKSASEPAKKRTTGYTNAFDYSYGKYKGDYKKSREENRDIVTKTLRQKDEYKAFTPSPIISPVYGVLNENYKKEDIVSKSDQKPSTTESLDLDSVRRKAYGTLEDEIVESLSSREEIEIEEAPRDDYDNLDDDGISINDLLIDSSEVDAIEEPTEAVFEEEKREEDTKALLDDLVDDEEIIEEEEVENSVVYEDVPPKEVIEPVEEEEKPKIEFEEDPVPDSIIIPEEEPNKKANDKKDSIGEEDLFDLIDSLYEGKGED